MKLTERQPMNIIVNSKRTGEAIINTEIKPTLSTKFKKTVREIMSDYCGHELNIVESNVGQHEALLVNNGMVLETLKFNIEYES